MSTAHPAFRLDAVNGGIWTLMFDLPGEKVNKLSRDVMTQFDALLGTLEQRSKSGEIQALILCSGKPGNFIAGADIEMIQAVKTAQDAETLSRTGQKLLDRWEDLSFPTIAAIDGAALGGGCEFALACRAIVMSNASSAKIGLPEVMLGIIPGMGGCVRLPRKIGLAGALDLILTGKTLNGERAFKQGLADAVVPKEDFLGYTLKWVQTNLKNLKDKTVLIGRKPALGGVGGAMGSAFEFTPMGRAFMLKKAREGVLSRTKGHYPSPIEAIEVLRSNGAHYGPKVAGRARDAQMAREAQGFGRLAVTDVSKNLIRIFFLTEEVKKSKGVAQASETREIRQAAVLGAGVMGGGVAQLLAQQDVPVRMKDLNTAALTLGTQAASSIFKKSVQRRKLTPRQYLQKMNRVVPTTDYSGFKTTDFVIEAIVENMEIKKKVFQELEAELPSHAVVASNTSSLSVTEMQTVFKHPERFGGMHFFNPVAKMPLIEVIRGAKTSDETVSAIYQFSKKLGKTPIVVKDAPGFLVNRLLMPYLNEATHLLAEGAPIPQIDRVMLAFGMPMGPIELIDEVGIDVGEKVAKILHQAFGARFEPAPMNHKMVEAKRFGKKSQKGFYPYDARGRKGEFSSEVYSLLGVTPQNGKFKDQEILDRCLLPMINEASRCLEEGIVSSANEVDLGMIMGTGFPPFRGGLLRYADTLGAKELVSRLEKYKQQLGARYEPASALVARAQSGRLFHERS